MPFNETRERRHVITVEDGNGSAGDRAVGGDGDHGWVITREIWMREIEVPHLDLVVTVPLLALDDDQIARSELAEYRFQRRLRVIPRLVDDRPAVARDDRHL